jgi:molybdopterin/thiamine biosynthesis adenylyltransferase/nitroreductase
VSAPSIVETLAGDWRPEILDERISDDRSRLRILQADPRIETIDRLSHMRAELAKIVPAVGPELLTEQPRWVHYPWRRAVVAVLGPVAYRQLRLDRNRNKITAAEQDRLGRWRIAVIGQSVGHAIAHTLAMEGLCGRIRLADFDDLEVSNLNRVPATVLDVGVNKAVVTARRIAELDPYLDVEVCAGGVTDDTLASFFDGVDLLVEECDSLDIKVAAREAARERGIPVVMETSDRGLIDVERFDLEPDRPVFHGLLGDLSAAELRGLSTIDKIPHILRILDPDQLSATMAASMAEVGETLTTWPQLAEDVTLGAATVAAAVRKTARGEAQSGRSRVDLDNILDRIAGPEVARPAAAQEAVADAEVSDKDATENILHSEILRAASLAPSGGNIQPWEFVTAENRVEIHLVPERSTTMDVEFRASYLAIGAALGNARIAAAAAGRLGSVELLPPGTPDRLAVLHLTDPAAGNGTAAELAAELPAMLARCANRQPGRPALLDPALIDELHDVVESESGVLHLLTDRADIDACAELLGAADRIRYLDARLHREMMGELRWPDIDRLDLGLDVRTLELDPADLAKLAVARRPDVMATLAEWGAGRALGEPTRDSVRSSSAVAVVTVPGGTPEHYLRGGAAVERLWIRAQARGLGVQPVSPVFLFAQSDEDIAGLVGTPHRAELAHLAQQFRSLSAVPTNEEFALILRLSHAPAPTARSQRLGLKALVRGVDDSGSGIEADG